MPSVIQISNLSKIYRLGEIGTGTISRDLERWYKMKIRGHEDPFLKIGEINERNKKGVSDVVYSLRDINFEVKQGEALGIIGKNGAGKSTLLKIISRVTSPTTGKIHIKGRVASLLEVGTGFHPELTGRENIYLNGAILGMRKKEVTRKLDEIIDFSGVERYIDTPVKRYSSGMYVRMAFAVAAHLESEIMVVDEVLAVGDAEFQKKCLGKMGEVSKGEGRTVLFVSHNMAAMQALCSRAILLDNGSLALMGTPQNVVSGYLDAGLKTFADLDFSQIRDRKGDNNYLRFISFDAFGSNGKSLTDIPCGIKVKFELGFQVFTDEISNLRIGINFTDRNTGIVATELNSYYGSKEILSCKKGVNKYVFTVNHLPLNANHYNVGFIATSGLQVLDWLKDACQLTVSEGLFYESGHMPLDRNSQFFFTEYTCGLKNGNEINH